MSKTRRSTFSILYESSTAQKVAELDLGFGRSCAIWTNSDDHVLYDQLEGHTFSFYIRGGQGVWRMDQTPVHGWPGAVCIFPHGQSSEWLIGSPLEMVHLYMPDTELRRFYSEMFDRDGREISLADVTYSKAGALAPSFAGLANAMQQGDSIRAEEAMLDLVAGAFSQNGFSETRSSMLKGGLAPRTKRHLVEYIEAHLDEVIRLQDLANVANLSEFHLQRSFKESCGVSPHHFIAHRRIERAKEQIRSGDPLAQIAEACGFSSQSHFTRSFKAGVGVTPAGYRSAIG